MPATSETARVESVAHGVADPRVLVATADTALYCTARDREAPPLGAGVRRPHRDPTGTPQRRARPAPTMLVRTTRRAAGQASRGRHVRKWRPKTSISWTPIPAERQPGSQLKRRSFRARRRERLRNLTAAPVAMPRPSGLPARMHPDRTAPGGRTDRGYDRHARGSMEARDVASGPRAGVAAGLADQCLWRRARPGSRCLGWRDDHDNMAAAFAT
jgi:hypothetical protein